VNGLSQLAQQSLSSLTFVWDRHEAICRQLLCWLHRQLLWTAPCSVKHTKITPTARLITSVFTSPQHENELQHYKKVRSVSQLASQRLAALSIQMGYIMPACIV